LRLHSRSAAEEKSRLKALQNKADKGLLNEEEMEQLRQLQNAKKDDCIIM